MTTSDTLITGPWDADATTVFYAAPGEEDAVTFIEIRANVTESGWDTVAFIDAAGPGTRSVTDLIKAAPALLEALEAQAMAEADPEASKRKGYFERAREMRHAALRLAGRPVW